MARQTVHVEWMDGERREYTGDETSLDKNARVLSIADVIYGRREHVATIVLENVREYKVVN
jgi:hypothetical protein